MPSTFLKEELYITFNIESVETLTDVLSPLRLLNICRKTLDNSVHLVSVLYDVKCFLRGILMCHMLYFFVVVTARSMSHQLLVNVCSTVMSCVICDACSQA